MICDFCAGPNVVWSYPAAPFVLDGTPLGSDDRWAACHECAELVEKGDREALLRRTLGTYPAPLRTIFEPYVRKLHRKFFELRQGGASPAHREAVV